MKKYIVKLHEEEQEMLQHLLVQGKASARKLTHARILLKACIDDVLTVGNGDHLLHSERFFPAEETRDVGRAMIERQEIERSGISRDHE